MCRDIVRYNKSWNLGHLSEPDGGSFFFSHEAKLRSKAVTKCFISLSNHRLKWKFSLCAMQDLTILISQNLNIYPIQRERIQNIICLSYSPRGCQYQFKAIIIWVGNILYMFIWKIFITECIHKVDFPEIYLKKILRDYWNEMFLRTANYHVLTLLTLKKNQSYSPTPLKINHIVNYIWHMQLCTDILYLTAEQGLELFVATAHFKYQEYNICCDDKKINKLVKYL